MRIGIVGCGAMGSVYAGLLADAGNNVIVVDTWSAHVEKINSDGLRVEGASGDRTVRVEAMLKPEGIPVDLLIIAVKSAQAANAAASCAPILSEKTIVLTIQNGLGAADLVADTIGEYRLIVGIAAAFGASLTGPGHAHHNGMEAIKMGPFNSLEFEKAEQISDVWRDAGFNAEAVENVIAMQWEKLICNVAYSAPCALTDLTVGEVMESEEVGPVSRAAAIEAWNVARALGIEISVDDPIEHIQAFARRVFNAKPSVLLDHESGRRSEIDFINAAIPREAKKTDLNAPVNETLVGLIKHKETKLNFM